MLQWDSRPFFEETEQSGRGGQYEENTDEVSQKNSFKGRNKEQRCTMIKLLFQFSVSL